MSDPTAKALNDPRVGNTWISDRYATMRCDGGTGGCHLAVALAPRIHIPPRPIDENAPDALRAWTTLHYCTAHAFQLLPAVERSRQEKRLVELLLSDRGMRGQLEAVAKRKWPHDYRPDFDHAYLKWWRVTTPEYRQYLSKLQLDNMTRVEGAPLI